MTQRLYPWLWLVIAGTAHGAGWPTQTHLSGSAFLPSGLLALQDDATHGPIALWLDKGAALWRDSSTGQSCQSCHGALDSLRDVAPRYPKLSAQGDRLINLEDQILQCRTRTGRTGNTLEDDEVLALSAVLHRAAQGQAIAAQAPVQHAAQWQVQLSRGAQLFSTRMGRMNLACMHCHDQNVGKQMRTDVVSPANPTGFPVYRMAWQRLGSIDRRLRACYSGVQAVMPPAGDPDLRALELYLKVRASGTPLDGPSIRR